MLPTPVQSPKSEVQLEPSDPINASVLPDPQSDISLLDCPTVVL